MTRDQSGKEPGPFDLTDEIGTSIGAKGNEVDRTLPRDPAAAEPLAREEYALFLEAERQQQRRLHKGHPLHNIGVILVHTGRFDEARTYFHAAHAEDARSIDADDSTWGWLAHQVLVDLYGERPSELGRLAEMARSSDAEPLELARRFEHDNGPFNDYRGLRAGWRDDAELDPFRRDQLVFCAGSHSLPHHLKAMADGVREAGLQPVVVMEFRNPAGYDAADSIERARLDYEKSERLLDRCGRVVMDVSDQKGQTLELEKAKQAKLQIYIGFVSADTRAPRPHGSSMVTGAAVAAGVRPVPFRGTDELRANVRDWCAARSGPASSATVTPSSAMTPGIQGSNIVIAGGSAMPWTVPQPLDFTTQVAVPSGSHIVPDDYFVVGPVEDDDPSL